jgi:integrase
MLVRLDVAVTNPAVSKIHRHIEAMSRVNKFLTSKKRSAANTVIGYKTSLAYFQQFLTKDYNDQTLETIIALLASNKIDVYDILDHFVSFLQSNKLTRSSIHQYLVGIRSYFLFNDIDIVDSKFKRKVTMPKNIKEEDQALDQQDIRKLLLKCNSRRLKTYILILASSGLRANEACTIRLCDIDFEYKPVRIHIRGEFTKTKVSRKVFISDEAAEYVKDWINYMFEIDVDRIKNTNIQLDKRLLFQVHENMNSQSRSIYQKLNSQFHTVLRSAGLEAIKDGTTHRRTITLHSFRRFVKTTISDSPAGSDYSEWFLGHTKSSYYVSKPEVRAEIYATKCMKYFTYLDYSTLEARGKNIDARINELENEKQIMNQKHEEEMRTMQEQIDHIIEIVKYPHTRARMLIKPTPKGLVEPNARRLTLASRLPNKK